MRSPSLEDRAVGKVGPSHDIYNEDSSRPLCNCIAGIIILNFSWKASHYIIYPFPQCLQSYTPLLHHHVFSSSHSFRSNEAINPNILSNQNSRWTRITILLRIIPLPFQSGVRATAELRRRATFGATEAACVPWHERRVRWWSMGARWEQSGCVRDLALVLDGCVRLLLSRSRHAPSAVLDQRCPHPWCQGLPFLLSNFFFFWS